VPAEHESLMPQSDRVAVRLHVISVRAGPGRLRVVIPDIAYSVRERKVAETAHPS
jgi:hypothetical protein